MRRKSWALASAALALGLGCAPESKSIATGTASGSASCDIFLAGRNPPDIGDGVAQGTLGGDDFTLAEGAAAFAVDGNGSQVSDPSQAAYFSIQIYQYLSPTRMELFELRVVPDHWASGDIVLDGVSAGGLFGRVDFDPNGNAIDAVVLATVVGGQLHVDAAGRNLGDPVAASFSGIRLSAE